MIKQQRKRLAIAAAIALLAGCATLNNLEIADSMSTFLAKNGLD